jgi:hypothetical protein
MSAVMRWPAARAASTLAIAASSLLPLGCPACLKW